RAGMDSVAVAYGAQSLEQLRPYAPRLEVEHFTELRAWLGGARRAGDESRHRYSPTAPDCRPDC
ncbi:hypothetical protein FLI59_34485, partial [Pseudomonas aeruginosa]